jgi:hypothetical protein
MFSLWLGHALSQAEWLPERAPGAQHLAWLFPAQYQLRLWSPDWLTSLFAMGALLGIGAAAFGLGLLGFRRRDA